MRSNSSITCLNTTQARSINLIIDGSAFNSCLIRIRGSIQSVVERLRLFDVIMENKGGDDAGSKHVVYNNFIIPTERNIKSVRDDGGGGAFKQTEGN